MVPISTVMRRLLTGYGQQFHRRHNHCGVLFQNRYKSFLCEEGPYLLELVRYILLNPVRARVVNAHEEYERRSRFRLRGLSLEKIIDTVSVYFEI
jgi:hypothetical protein